jgi:hypothetical protein
MVSAKLVTGTWRKWRNETRGRITLNQRPNDYEHGNARGTQRGYGTRRATLNDVLFLASRTQSYPHSQGRFNNCGGIGFSEFLYGWKGVSHSTSRGPIGAAFVYSQESRTILCTPHASG